MGRPLRKDVNGVDVIGTYSSDTGVRVQFYDSALRTDGVIVKQRGAKTFVVTRVGNVGSPHLNDSTNTTTAVLKNGTPTASGEMLLEGFIGGNGASGTPLAKITKRVATDFSGNRYTWYLQNDSTNDYIVLTAI